MLVTTGQTSIKVTIHSIYHLDLTNLPFIYSAKLSADIVKFSQKIRS